MALIPARIKAKIHATGELTYLTMRFIKIKLESFLNKTYPFFVRNLSISRQKGPPDRHPKRWMPITSNTESLFHAIRTMVSPQSAIPARELADVRSIMNLASYARKHIQERGPPHAHFLQTPSCKRVAMYGSSGGKTLIGVLRTSSGETLKIVYNFGDTLLPANSDDPCVRHARIVIADG